jgi:type I restriction enzyme, S subunit
MSDLNDLPENWTSATFGDICKVQGGFAFKSQDYQSNGILLIRISNLVDGKASQLSRGFTIISSKHR